MSDVPPRATEIWAGQPGLRRSQLRTGNNAAVFRFVSSGRPGAKWRNIWGGGKGRRMQGRRWAAGTILGCAILCGAFVCGEGFAETDPSAQIARGKALTVAGDCASCHTADPAKPFAGGKRIDTPFGAITSPNLTPDPDTGLGRWGDEDFVRALRDGVAPDGSRYYPAFPYPNFTRLIRDDILAIRAYLGTLTPIRNTAPAPELRWPLNYRVLMRGWNYLFLKPGIVMPDQSKGTEWNRGRYLVEGIAHCGACHTPKNM